MRVVIQRVSEASVTIDGTIEGKIETGFMILLGIGHEDTIEDIEWLVQKITNLRVFGDEDGKMNLSILDIKGEILLISQFTLFASTKKGNRPSFIQSAKPEFAIPLYEKFIDALKGSNIRVETGKFGADMKVMLVNDGPVTIIIDSKNRE
jgi:D-tyrosyl-tRNA(Tyr) deacylase